jgi:hypothetical protein
LGAYRPDLRELGSRPAAISPPGAQNGAGGTRSILGRAQSAKLQERSWRVRAGTGSRVRLAVWVWALAPVTFSPPFHAEHLAACHHEIPRRKHKHSCQLRSEDSAGERLRIHRQGRPGTLDQPCLLRADLVEEEQRSLTGRWPGST